MKVILGGLLKVAGIKVNGDHPWDMQVHDPRTYRETVSRGSLGLAESYINGWWDCYDLAGFFRRLLSSPVRYAGELNPITFARRWKDATKPQITETEAYQVGKEHYDLGNDLYSCMLGPTMTYTCGYFTSTFTQSLNCAQENKFDLICRKLRLEPGMRVLDIGCGFGPLACYMAERYKAEVTGITISQNQAAYARMRSENLPVTVKLENYKRTTGRYDRIVSVGMFEHVERQDYDAYFNCIDRCLDPEGLCLLHAIGTYDRMGSDPFIRKYIFPQGMVPNERTLRRAIGPHFYTLDWHKFGSNHYARTLELWHKNFLGSWPMLAGEYGNLFDGRFKRVWEYYLLACSGAFAAGRMDVWQLLLSKYPQDIKPIR